MNWKVEFFTKTFDFIPRKAVDIDYVQNRHKTTLKPHRFFIKSNLAKKIYKTYPRENEKPVNAYGNLW